jgi:NADH-quinone oxidoreductase subunit A
MLSYEYVRFLDYTVVVLLVVTLMVVLAFFFAPSAPSRDKLTAYECGFHPFEDARKEFSVHFYLVALLFVAFDLEILILLPWVLNVPLLDAGVYWQVIVFLLVVFGGFLYEWKSGALDW